MAEAGGDSSVLDASVLVDWGLGSRQDVLKTGEGRLESCMTDNRLVGGRDVDAHYKQGPGVEWMEGG